MYDRELSLSGNATERDAGMLAYIGINGAGFTAAQAGGPFATATARADTYNALVAGQTLTVSDPSKGVIANDTNVYGVTLLAAPTNGTVTLNANGTFTYVPTGTATSDSFYLLRKRHGHRDHLFLRHHRHGDPGRRRTSRDLPGSPARQHIQRRTWRTYVAIKTPWRPGGLQRRGELTPYS